MYVLQVQTHIANLALDEDEHPARAKTGGKPLDQACVAW
jgi:hypothetical protein